MNEVKFRRNITIDQAMGYTDSSHTTLWTEWDKDTIYFTTDQYLVMNRQVYGDGGVTATLQVTGEWNPESPYIINNVVYYGGNSYICIQNITPVIGTQVPVPGAPSSKSYWVMFARGTNIYETVTWSALREMISNNSLIAGCRYRIIDYITNYDCTDTGICTDSCKSTESVRCLQHRFDVVVMATSDNTLSPEAEATYHKGDNYFDNTNIQAWKLWYNIENDISFSKLCFKGRPLQPTGTGIIYRMIDEWGNDLPFDFKNIQFRRADSSSYRTTYLETTADELCSSKYMRINDIVAYNMIMTLINSKYLAWSHWGNPIGNAQRPSSLDPDEGYRYLDGSAVEFSYSAISYREAYGGGSVILQDNKPSNWALWPGPQNLSLSIPGSKLAFIIGRLNTHKDFEVNMSPWFYTFSTVDDDNNISDTTFTAFAKNNTFNPYSCFENTIFICTSNENTFDNNKFIGDVTDCTFIVTPNNDGTPSSIRHNNFNNSIHSCVMMTGANSGLYITASRDIKENNFSVIHNCLFVGGIQFSEFRGENYDLFINNSISNTIFTNCYNIFSQSGAGSPEYYKYHSHNKIDINQSTFGSGCHDLFLGNTNSITFGAKCHNVSCNMTFEKVYNTVSWPDYKFVNGYAINIKASDYINPCFHTINIGSGAANISIAGLGLTSDDNKEFIDINVAPGFRGAIDGTGEYIDDYYNYIIDKIIPGSDTMPRQIHNISQEGVKDIIIEKPGNYIEDRLIMYGKSINVMDTLGASGNFVENPTLNYTLCSELLDKGIDTFDPNLVPFVSYPFEISAGASFIWSYSDSVNPVFTGGDYTQYAMLFEVNKYEIGERLTRTLFNPSKDSLNIWGEYYSIKTINIPVEFDINNKVDKISPGYSMRYMNDTGCAKNFVLFIPIISREAILAEKRELLHYLINK